MRIIASLMALFCGLLSMQASAADLVVGKFEHHGLERRYLVHAPSGLRPGAPMLMMFHGGGGNPEQFSKDRAILGLSERHGFLLVFPAGTGARDRMLTWNAGNCCGRAQEENIDDVGYVAALIDILADRYAIDRRRVYASGHSNGAQISYRLACELRDRIAAIAPVGSGGSFTTCPDGRPVPTLHIHGTADQCARWEGGHCGGCYARMFQTLGFSGSGRDQGWTCQPIPETLANWARRNGCAGNPITSRERPGITRQDWTNCPGRVEVTLLALEGAGHTWPGARPAAFCDRRPDGRLCRAYMEVVGPPTNVIDADSVIWSFLSRHRLGEN